MEEDQLSGASGTNASGTKYLSVFAASFGDSLRCSSVR